jgi:hypothetical protein
LCRSDRRSSERLCLYYALVPSIKCSVIGKLTTYHLLLCMCTRQALPWSSASFHLARCNCTNKVHRPDVCMCRSGKEHVSASLPREPVLPTQKLDNDKRPCTAHPVQSASAELDQTAHRLGYRSQSHLQQAASLFSKTPRALRLVADSSPDPPGKQIPGSQHV